ncbi:MAG: sulfatase-like hydrolase/transferase [Candidatus Hinthialibacter sp.]
MKLSSRRQFLKAAGAGAVLSALPGRHTVSSRQIPDPKDKPNFVFILTDDQRFDALRCAGNPHIYTPNLDSLAARGVRFDRGYVTLSICSPSRAACLTGRYGGANGVTRVGNHVRLNDGEKTFAHYFQEAGYRTGFVGKWHLGNTPEECGFDFHTYFISNGKYYDRSVIEMGGEAVAEGFIEDYNADQSSGFIERARAAGEPFVLFHCTQIPHMNNEFDWNVRPETLSRYDLSQMPVPVTWEGDLTGKPPYLKNARNRLQALQYGYDSKENIQRHLQRYYAAVTEMDASLGKLLKTLDQLGLRDQTYIFFYGDNGWLMGEHRFTSKVLPYEPSIRVPMIVSGPGLRPTEDRHLVLNIDFAPTMLDLAGLPIPESMQGSSLTPLLNQQSNIPWRTSFLYEAPESNLGSWPLYAVCTDYWKYIQTYDINDPTQLAFEELYDIQKDPHEIQNRIHDPRYAEILNMLKTEMERLRKNPGA